MKKAFSLIELVITLVILSIVAYISSGLIARTYIGYNQTNAIHRANLKVEIALNSIVNRLEDAIEGTIVKRQSATSNAIESIDQAPLYYNVLEWVGYDRDGFNAHNRRSGGTSYAVIDQPAWSGFCNIEQSTQTQIVTPGSDLNLANEIIDRLSNHSANFRIRNSVAIFFPGNYDYRNIGYNGSSNSGVALIQNYNNAQNKLFLSKAVDRITEQYKLAWSAYAVVPKNCNSDGCDLYLRYNFRPWLNEDYNSPRVVRNEKLLATNVTVFKTYATQNRVHIKICVKEKFGANKNASICKEKVVFKW